MKEVLALALLLLAPAPPETDSARLKRLFDLHWETSLREGPEFATYIGHPNDRWSDLSPEGMALMYDTVREELAALSAIDRSRLTETEQVNYDLLRRRLERQIEGRRFGDLGSYLVIDHMGGIDIDLVQLLDFMPARTVQDYEAMLTRMRGFPRVVDQTLALLAKGLEAGITPTRVTLRDVPERVGSLLGPESPVLKRFQAAPDERLRAEAGRVFAGQVEPALRKLRDYLANTYIPQARETIAMSDLPDGKAWYAFKLRTNTTTGLTPEQIHQLGLSEVSRIRKEMDALIASTGFRGSFAEFSEFLRTDPRFFYERPEDLVAGYRDIAKRIDPALIKLFGRLPRLPYGVKVLEGDGAKSAPAGYYNNGSVAGGFPGWFLVNTYDLKARPKWAMEALTLHEAVPGHHLQYSIAQEIEDLPEWRVWDAYGPFAEGWALYAESLGTELGLYQDPYSNFGRLSNEIWRALRLVVDTGLHDRGWTRQHALDYYMTNTARTGHEIENEVDRIIAHPGSVPVYKIGELKIKELRAYAEKELGAAFDIRAFHDHLLGQGQLPLDLLEKRMRDWVSAQRPRR
ncbi:MAG TPA: DUF885 domain-containing protein [Thermoanaerobaculia bacterium]|nr:DUF885 domain-containing protein [Thermoanaerobaculia bacterium]